MKTILISPEYGAGWSTWADKEVATYIAEYQPIIEYIRRGNKFSDDYQINDKHPLVIQLHEDIRKEFGKDYYIFTGGMGDLVVEEVSEPYEIKDYDGFERIV